MKRAIASSPTQLKAGDRAGQIKAGDRVVFLGDSITEQRMYTNFVENYLLTRWPGLNLSFFNAGWGGDTAVGGDKRLERDVLALRPSLVTICYGMNDAGYGYAKPADAAARYGKHLRAIVDRLKRKKVRVVLMTNGIVDDTRPALKWLKDITDYNKEALRAVANETLKVAAERGLPVVDLHALMTRTLERSKQDGIDIGDEGLHPDEGGSLIMTAAMLEVLGVPPRRETIEFDARGGKRRFNLKPASLPYYVEEKARRMVPYLPRMTDLNDVRVVVRNLPGSSAYLRIDGAATPVFSRAELEAGIPVTDMWGIAPMVAADRVNRITREKCNLYRQFWRALALPDNYIVTAPYDPGPHKLGIKMADEIAAWRKKGLNPPVCRVEVVPVEVSAQPLGKGGVITRWAVWRLFSPAAGPDEKKEDRVRLTGESGELPPAWRPVVLDTADGAVRSAYLAGDPWIVCALCRLESDREQEVVLRVDHPGDILVNANGVTVKQVKAADPDREVRLSLRAGSNRVIVEIWREKEPTNVLKARLEAAGQVRQSF